MKKIIAVIAVAFLLNMPVGCNTPDRSPEIEPAQGVKIEFIGRVDGSNIYKITMPDSTVVLYGINNGNDGHEAMAKIK